VWGSSRPGQRGPSLACRRRSGTWTPATFVTAKSHVGRLLTKLGARDRAQLVIAAYEAGLMTLGSS